MDTCSNSRSESFRELRLAAGFESQAAVSRKIEVRKGTLYDWDKGAKPRWRYIPQLAALFNKTPEELVKSLWHEEVGSPCSCGCGNKKALPDYDGAQHLYVERVCVNCDDKKILRLPAARGKKHPSLCEHCFYVTVGGNLAAPRSLFHKLRLAAGAQSNQIAKAVGVDGSTVREWDLGHRPWWRYMPVLSQLFKIDLPEAVRLFWGESVDDVCACGCAGKKILPTKDRAIHLYTERTCSGCEHKRIFRTPQHTAACIRCKHAGKLVPRVTVRCEGYRPYGVRVHRFAKTCPRTVTRRRSYFKRHRTQDDGLRPFANETEGKYRCSRCSAALQGIYGIEKHVKEFWALANPNKNIPQIRSLKELRKLQRDCYQLSYKNAAGHVVTFHPEGFSPGVKRPHKGNSRPHSVSYIKSMLAGQCRRRGLPKAVHGLCLRCDKLVLSNGGMKGKPPRLHAKCLYDYQREYGPHAKLSAEPVKRGARPTRESLQRHWAWTVRHKLGGDSLGDIAEEFGIRKQSVADAIWFIMSHLPSPELVARQFQQRILLLQSHPNLI